MPCTALPATAVSPYPGARRESHISPHTEASFSLVSSVPDLAPAESREAIATTFPVCPRWLWHQGCQAPPRPAKRGSNEPGLLAFGQKPSEKDALPLPILGTTPLSRRRTLQAQPFANLLEPTVRVIDCSEEVSAHMRVPRSRRSCFLLTQTLHMLSLHGCSGAFSPRLGSDHVRSAGHLLLARRGGAPRRRASASMSQRASAKKGYAFRRSSKTKEDHHCRAVVSDRGSHGNLAKDEPAAASFVRSPEGDGGSASCFGEDISSCNLSAIGVLPEPATLFSFSPGQDTAATSKDECQDEPWFVGYSRFRKDTGVGSIGRREGGPLSLPPPRSQEMC